MDVLTSYVLWTYLLTAAVALVGWGRRKGWWLALVPLWQLRMVYVLGDRSRLYLLAFFPYGFLVFVGFLLLMEAAGAH